MALAPFHRRAALAAAQILDGFDEEQFETALADPVGISIGQTDAQSPNGRALADLTVRLLARLYPQLELRLDDAQQRTHLESLAQAINPEIEFREASTGIVIGSGTPFERSIFAGCDGWDALVSTNRELSIGQDENVFGAGAAACIAAANLFRAVVLAETDRLDEDVRYSTFHLDQVAADAEAPPSLAPFELIECALVGVGAIGNATVWALARAPAQGSIFLVDHERVELSNLQRYVLADLSAVDRPKVEIAAEFLHDTQLQAEPVTARFDEFIGAAEPLKRIAVAVDNRRDRIAAQAALPRSIFNAWTQPGDLGVSTHPSFGDAGACLSCIYFPDHPLPNEDELVAAALGIPALFRDVRGLLASGAPTPPALLEIIAAGLGVNPDALAPFADKPIRALYVEGVCGGAVVPLASVGRPRQDAHVPLAHQSALAGVLLAARLARHLGGNGPMRTAVSRFNVLAPVGVELTQFRPQIEGHRCLCQDDDFLSAYRKRWQR